MKYIYIYIYIYIYVCVCVCACVCVCVCVYVSVCVCVYIYIYIYNVWVIYKRINCGSHYVKTSQSSFVCSQLNDFRYCYLKLTILLALKWFQVLLLNTNNLIQYSLIVWTPLNGFKYCNLSEIILFFQYSSLIRITCKQIASTLRCRGGRYSSPWIAPLYLWYIPFIAEC